MPKMELHVEIEVRSSKECAKQTLNKHTDRQTTLVDPTCGREKQICATSQARKAKGADRLPKCYKMVLAKANYFNELIFKKEDG